MKKSAFFLIIMGMLLFSCANDSSEVAEAFSLKKYKNTMDESGKMAVTKTWYDRGGDDFGCDGAEGGCKEVIVTNGSGNRSSNSLESYIPSDVEDAFQKGLLTKEVRFKEKENNEYIIYTDINGEKLVYSFKIK